MTYFNRQYLRAAKKLGHKPPPEQHLIKAMWAAVIGPISLFAFAWTSQPSVHWAAAVCSSLPFGIAFTLAFTASFTYKVDAYRPYAASAMGANSFLRSSFAAAFPLFTVQMVSSGRLAISPRSGLTRLSSLPVHEAGRQLGWHAHCLPAARHDALALPVLPIWGTATQQIQIFKHFMTMFASIAYSMCCCTTTSRLERPHRQAVTSAYFTFQGSAMSRKGAVPFPPYSLGSRSA